MPAWGTEGGGPLTTQQIDELIAYIGSIQLTSDEAKAEVEERAARRARASATDDEIDWDDPATGEALFNLGLENGFAGGAYSCARCHTKGASFEYGPVEPEDADLSDYAGFPDGSGAFGFALTSGVIPRQFLSIEDLIDFLAEGTEYGMLYGQRGQGTGRMPGFGDNPDDADDLDDDVPGDGMFTDEMICSVAKYEASLGADAEPITAGCDRLVEAAGDDDHRGRRPPRHGRRGGRGVTMVHLLAGIAWDPQIRGFLAVLVGVVVLMGSVYLLLGTNLGARLGFLVAISAIFGWCTIMGVTWWVYGNIGMLGETPHWEVEEIVYQAGGTAEDGLALADLEKAHELDTSSLPPPEELQELDEDEIAELAGGGRPTRSARGRSSPESNPAFGEAKATVDEHFVATPLTRSSGSRAPPTTSPCTPSRRAARTTCPTTRAASTASPTS